MYSLKQSTRTDVSQWLVMLAHEVATYSGIKEFDSYNDAYFYAKQDFGPGWYDVTIYAISGGKLEYVVANPKA